MTNNGWRYPFADNLLEVGPLVGEQMTYQLATGGFRGASDREVLAMISTKSPMSNTMKTHRYRYRNRYVS